MKAYHVEGFKDYELAVAVIAEDRQQARCVGFEVLKDWCGDLPFIEVRAKLIKNCDIDGLPIGAVMDGEEGIRRGIYLGMDEGVCDGCKRDWEHVRGWRKEGVGRYLCLCQDCIDKQSKPITAEGEG